MRGTEMRGTDLKVRELKMKGGEIKGGKELQHGRGTKSESSGEKR